MTELIPRTKGTLRFVPNDNPTDREGWPIHDRAVEAIMPRYKPSQAALDALQASIDKWEEERGML